MIHLSIYRLSLLALLLTFHLVSQDLRPESSVQVYYEVFDMRYSAFTWVDSEFVSWRIFMATARLRSPSSISPAIVPYLLA